MSKTVQVQLDPGILAVLHKTGPQWRVLVASTKGPLPAVLSVKSFPPDQCSRIDAWLDEQHASQVLCLLPAGSVICRNCSLPDAAPEQLQQALRLQAEVHLLGNAPAHRLAMAVLPAAKGETTRSGIILAWPEAAVVDPPPTTRPVKYVPDIAALAGLLNGNRPDEPVMWLDRSDGSVALAISHPNGAVFRATREDAQSPETWQRSVNRVLAETSLSVGHTGPFVESLIRAAQPGITGVKVNGSTLSAPQDITHQAASRAQGVNGDPNWWSQYGVAFGAVLARTGQLASLTQLELAPPVQKPSRINTLLDKLSQPRGAAVAIIACIAVLALGPVAFSGLRLLALNLRFGDIEEQQASLQQVKNQYDMYQELDKKAWSMTKLLSDIASNTPEGIEFEMVRVDQGKDFYVKGTSRSSGSRKADDVFSLMQQNLQKSGLFHNLAGKIGDGNNLGVYSIELNANIRNPHLFPTYEVERDWKAWKLADRIYGNGKPPTPDTKAPETTAVAAATTTEGSPDEPSSAGSAVPAVDSSSEGSGEKPLASAGDNPRIPRTGSGANGSGAVPFTDPDVRSESSVPDSLAAPPPLTEAEVAAMSKSEAQERFLQIAKYEKHAKDEEEKARLKKERGMLLARMKEADSAK